MTAAQLNARRQNAQLSTGPRTSAGKKRSSLNAVRHGLTGQIIVHTAEDQEAFTKHCDGIREALAPVGALEIDLAQAIAEDRWRLNRARALENSIFALGQTEHVPQDSEQPELDAALSQGRTWMAHARELQLLSLYESRIRRSVEKNTAELLALQDERQDAADEAPPKRVLIPRFVGRKGKDDGPAGDLPPETPDSSVRSFKGHPASESLESQRFTEKSAKRLPRPATRPSRPRPPQQVPPQRTTPKPGIKQPEDTESKPWPSEFVRNPLGQLVPRR